MKLGFVINDVATEKENYSTILLAIKAVGRGHDVALIGLSELTYGGDGELYANAVVPAQKSYADTASLLSEIQGEDVNYQRLDVGQLDVLMLRSDPADEMTSRPWASITGLLFAQLAVEKGVIVLNDPTHLTDAGNKTYFQGFPHEVRASSCISCNVDEIKKFIAENDHHVAIKPLQGSGGRSVFIITPEDKANVNQMIEAVLRDGYALVQRYLPKAAEGDLRMLMLNGKPLKVGDTYGCIQRYNDGDDARSNISAGGKYKLMEPDADALKVAEIVGPKLMQDGMYFVGLDIVGDKLLEVNVDTPGGLNMLEEITDADFSGHVLDDLEAKVRHKARYGHRLSSNRLACMS